MRTGKHTLVFQTNVNAGLIHNDRSAIVVDTLMGPIEAEQIRQAATSESVNVSYVFNTHHHDDHTMGNFIFDAPVVASDRDAETMRAWSRSEQHHRNLCLWLQRNPGAPQHTYLRCPEITFSSSMSICLEGLDVHFQLYGGHTRGSSIVMVPEDGVIYSGDLLFIGRYPFVGNCDMARWCRALRQLLDVARCYGTVVPGHGPVLTGYAIGHEIGRLLGFLEDTLGRASLLVQKGATREEALADRAFPWLESSQTDACERRQRCIEKAYLEALASGQK